MPITKITTIDLERAVEEGTGAGHLTAGQAWAAHHLAIPIERVQAPLSRQIEMQLCELEMGISKTFLKLLKEIDRDDTEALLAFGFNEAYPMFLRAPIVETYHKTINECLPRIAALKPNGYDENGKPTYSFADIAEAGDMTEGELQEAAKNQGVLDLLQQPPTHRVH